MLVEVVMTQTDFIDQGCNQLFHIVYLCHVDRPFPEQSLVFRTLENMFKNTFRKENSIELHMYSHLQMDLTLTGLKCGCSIKSHLSLTSVS